MEPSLRSLAVATFVLTTSACASYEHKVLDYGRAESSGHIATVDSVTISAEPFDTEAESVGAFDENLPKEGFIPVQLVVQNGATEDVLVLRETVELQSPDGQIYRPVPAVVMAEAVENSVLGQTLAFGIFGLFTAQEANKERSADYGAKELEEAKLVNPGAKYGAFVYFKLPKGVDVNSCRLKLQVRHLGSNQSSLFDLALF